MAVPRPLGAFLVGSLLMVTGFLVTGWSSAAADRESASFDLPAIQVGDQGQYNGSDGSTVAFLISHQGTWYDSEGAAFHGVHLLVSHASKQEVSTSGFWLDSQSLEPVAAWSAGGGSGSGIGVGVGPVDYGRYGGHTAIHMMWGHPGPWCGLLHDRIGQSSDASSSLRPIGDCESGSLPGKGTIEEAPGEAHIYGEPEQLQVVVAPAVPVPLQLTTGGITWNLTTFGRGAEPLEPPADDRRFAPQLERSAVHHGPDASGIEHDFQLADAVDDALASPVGNDLQAFFARHADAYIAAADYVQEREPGTRMDAWAIVATDGQAAISLRIERDAAEVARATGPLPADTGLDAPAAPIQRVTEAVPVAGPFPSPRALPSDLPSVASLAERWADHAASGREKERATAYGFAYRCGLTCHELEASIWVGQNATEAPVPRETPRVCILVCAADQPVWQASQLFVDAQGQSQSMVATEWVTRVYAGYDYANPQLDMSGRSVHTPPAAEGASPSAASWAWPSTSAAAGITFLGLVAAALYYLGTALKAGPLALFSRVRRDRALEHPVRAAISDAVHAEPGIHLQELGRRVGKQAGVLRHHVDVLVAKDLIKARRDRGYICFFPPTAGAATMQQAAVLRNPTAKQLLDQVNARPGQTMGDAAVALGVSAGTVTYHATRLEQRGLLRRHKVGRDVQLFAAA